MKQIIKISPTSIDYTELCARKFNYAKIKRLYPKMEGVDKYRQAKDRGDLVHQMLKKYYTIKKDSGVVPAERIIEIVTLCRAAKLVDSNLPSPIIEEAIRAFTDYVIFYRNEAWTILAVEEPFSKVLYDSPTIKILVEGIMDLVVKDRDERIFPVDHKSKDKNTYPLSLRNQFIAYVWALDTVRLIENGIGMQKTLAPSEKFKRELHSYNQKVINEWVEATIYHTLKIHGYIENNYFPPSYAHCWNCVYKDLCISDPDVREYKMEKEWNKGSDTDLFTTEIEIIQEETNAGA